MKLEITEIQILDEMGLVATVSVFDDNVAEIKLGDIGASIA